MVILDYETPSEPVPRRRRYGRNDDLTRAETNSLRIVYVLAGFCIIFGICLISAYEEVWGTAVIASAVALFYAFARVLARAINRRFQSLGKITGDHPIAM